MTYYISAHFKSNVQFLSIFEKEVTQILFHKKAKLFKVHQKACNMFLVHWLIYTFFFAVVLPTLNSFNSKSINCFRSYWYFDCFRSLGLLIFSCVKHVRIYFCIRTIQLILDAVPRTLTLSFLPAFNPCDNQLAPIMDFCFFRSSEFSVWPSFWAS